MKLPRPYEFKLINLVRLLETSVSQRSEHDNVLLQYLVVMMTWSRNIGEREDFFALRFIFTVFTKWYVEQKR